MFLLLNNNRSDDSSGQAFFHSCQPVGIDAFKVVRFSFPVISEFLTPFTTIVPDVSKRYHIGLENLFASMKKMSLRSSSTMKASAGRSHALFLGALIINVL